MGATVALLVVGVVLAKNEPPHPIASHRPMERSLRVSTDSTTSRSENDLTSSLATKPPVESTTGLAVRLPAEGPALGEATGMLLLLDDGIDGLTAVDLDRRLAGRSVVDGQRAGDEPYSMVRVADKLVVGWGEPHAVDIATRQSIPLGAATVFIPAAEADQVWMVDTGAHIGSREAVVWQVDVVTGQAKSRPAQLAIEGAPLMGISGGLAIQTEAGLTLWGAATDNTTSLESEGHGFVHDVSGESMVWCGGTCLKLVVTNTSTLESEEHPAPDGYDSFTWSGRISPSGRFLAALVGHNGDYHGRAIWLLDRQTGVSRVVADPTTYVDYLAWAPDDDQLFANSWSYGDSLTVVWRYQVVDRDFAVAVMPFGGALSSVVVENSVADAYIGDNPDLTKVCPAPSLHPSGRAGICAFRY